MVLINLLLAVILFAILIFISPLFVRILRIPKNERNIYSMMLIFSNLGFMGILIIEELYGKGAIIYVVLYSFVYSIIFYSYGIYLFEKEKALQTGEKAKIKFEWKDDQSRDCSELDCNGYFPISDQGAGTSSKFRGLSWKFMYSIVYDPDRSIGSKTSIDRSFQG